MPEDNTNQGGDQNQNQGGGDQNQTLLNDQNQGGGDQNQNQAPSFSIPDQYKGEAWALNIKSTEDLFDQFANAQRMIGVEKLPAPKEDWTPEQWNEFYGRLGRPGKPDEYQLPAVEMPEGLKPEADQFKAFFEKAHASGLTQNQVQEVVGYYLEDMKNAHQSAVSQAQTEVRETQEALQAEWGEKTEGKVSTAMELVKQVGSDGLLAAINNSGLGRNAEFIKFLAAVSEPFAEDNPRSPGRSLVLGGSGKAQQEIAQLKTDSDFMKAYTDRLHPGHKEAVDRMFNLQQIAAKG
jgi:hypothetical protein